MFSLLFLYLLFHLLYMYIINYITMTNNIFTNRNIKKYSQINIHVIPSYSERSRNFPLQG